MTDQFTYDFLKSFSDANLARCESYLGFNHSLSDWSLDDWSTAALGELGEASNIVKKLNRYRDGIPGNKESREELHDKLKSELADTFIYFDLLCQSVQIPLCDCVQTPVKQHIELADLSSVCMLTARHLINFHSAATLRQQFACELEANSVVQCLSAMLECIGTGLRESVSKKFAETSRKMKYFK